MLANTPDSVGRLELEVAYRLKDQGHEALHQHFKNHVVGSLSHHSMKIDILDGSVLAMFHSGTVLPNGLLEALDLFRVGMLGGECGDARLNQDTGISYLRHAGFAHSQHEGKEFPKRLDCGLGHKDSAT